MAAAIVRAVDQHAAHAGLAHVAEGDFLGAGQTATPIRPVRRCASSALARIEKQVREQASKPVVVTDGRYHSDTALEDEFRRVTLLGSERECAQASFVGIAGLAGAPLGTKLQ